MESTRTSTAGKLLRVLMAIVLSFWMVPVTHMDFAYADESAPGATQLTLGGGDNAPASQDAPAASAAPKGMGALGFAPMADGETVTIGTGANVPTSTSSHFPMACYYNNSVSEVIYLASEFVDSSSNQIANGTITSIAYHVGRANASSYSDLSIYMGYTDAATATSNITPTDPVLVYSNTNGRICSATGWETYELSTPFEYDSSRGNLIVVVIRNGSDCNSSSGYTVTSGTVSSRYYQNDSNSSSSLDVALGRLNNSDTNRPNTLFTIEAAGGPKFTTQPEGFAYQAGTANSTALTAVAESEDATFSYQWYKSSSADLKAEDLADTSKATAVGTQGTATTSEGSASVTYTPTAEDLGSTAGTVYFYCQATDSVGTSASKPAAVDVFTSAAQAPTNVTIASEPAATEGAVEANAGNAVALTASATAAETGDALYYQWFEKADGASDFTAIEGATEATYTTTAELNKTNTYRFEVWASHEVPTNTSEHVTSSEIAVTGKPITVSTEAELREIATNVNNGNSYEGMSITVTSDIELTSAWTPIGDTSAHAFKGTFDGDGHTISGLSIDTTSTYQGLFGYVNSATIKNLVVQGAVKSGSDSAGVVGYAAGATIENVGNEATVTAESAGNVGGVLGRGYSSTTVTACYNKGNVSGYNDNVGGIVGNGSNTSVTSCYNTGTVTMLRNSNNYYVGGIDGASAYVKNCVNAGTVSTVYASVDKGIGAIGGSSWQSISSADDACYYLDSSCAFAVNGAAQTNVNAVTAEQLSGAADYNGAPLLDALNTGAYADRWIAGGDQPSPKLFWEVVEGAPFITTHPASAEYAATDAIAALTCEAEYPEGSGSDTGLTYAWFKTTDRENAVGTGKTYTPTTQPGSSESFFCVVTNPNDGDPKTTTSKTATIKVLGDYAAETPVFSKPAEATAIEGKILTASALEAEVSVSKGDLTYQWYKATDATGAGAEAIEGATSTTYSFKPSDGGTYYFFCKATNTDEYARAGEQTATADSPVYTVTVGEYTISTPAELLAFKQSVNYSNTFEGVTVHLKADLDLQSDSTTQSWDPINNFAGTFDGEGHTIDGVQVSMTTSGAGLFGNTRVGVVIHDLIIGPNSSVTGTYNVGGIVGSTASSGTATIYNCGNHATVTATQANSSYSTNYSMAGGIVGGTYGTVNVTACYNKGAINGKTEGVGGIVGGVRSSSESDRYATVITSCYNAGTVTNENTSRSTGGISGYYTLIKNCLNFGSVPKGEASYNNYIGAIGGLRPQSVSATGNDVSYFLDTSSVNAVGCSVSSSSTSYADHTAAYYKKQTAAQLKAAAMVDTLNVGDYAGMWIAGGDSRTPQDYPALFWEEAGGMPTITQQPQSAEYDADATIEPLTVVAEKPEAGKTGSDGTLTYQWYKAPETGDPDPDVDEAIANATQASYTPALGADEVGRYYVAVTNTFGEKAPVAISDVAEVRVRGTHVAETPVFTTPTEAQTVSAMQPVATQIEAVATVDKGDLSYQWYKLDAADADKAAAEPIEGATESTFAPDTTELGTFYYFCRATNTDVSAKSGSQTATADSEVFTVEVKPLTISTEDELLAFSQLVNSGTTFAGATVELLADLDLGSDEDTQAWTPIGMSTSIAFKGTFEGNGHTITIDGMGVNSAGNAGLFGCVTDGAVIRNLTVDGEVTSADHNYLAAVCGYVQRGATFENVRNLANVTNTKTSGTSAPFAAGFVANATAGHTQFINCTNKGDITNTSHSQSHSYAAGFAYAAASSAQITLENCYNLGTIAAKASQYNKYAAALVALGTSNPPASSVAMSNCYNFGMIESGYGTGYALAPRVTIPVDSYYVEDENADAPTTVEGEGSATQKTADEMKTGDFLLLLGDAYIPGSSIEQSTPALAWEAEEDWADPVYTWADDNSTCTATRVDNNDESNVETETVDATSALTTLPTFETAGKVTYTATFANPAFTTQAKEVDSPKLAFTVKVDGVEVAADKIAVSAEGYDASYEDWQTGGKVESLIPLATVSLPCETAKVEIALNDAVAEYQNYLYTAQPDDSGYTQYVDYSFGDQKDASNRIAAANKAYEVDVPAADNVIRVQTAYDASFTSHNLFAIAFSVPKHDWQFVDFTWTGSETEGFTKAAANYTCANDGTHKHAVDASLTEKVDDPTCTEPGKTAYTATVAAGDSLDAEAHSESKDGKPTEALDHKWGEVAYTWADDNSTVTAKRTCEHDATHVEEETATVSAEVTTPAKCEAKGQTTYTATFENKAFEEQSKTLDDVDALGHKLGKVEKVDATCEEEGTAEHWKCSECGKLFADEAGEAEVALEDLKVAALDHDWDEGAVTKNPTATEPGERTYTCKRDASHKRTETIDPLGGLVVENGAPQQWVAGKPADVSAVAANLATDLGEKVVSWAWEYSADGKTGWKKSGAKTFAGDDDCFMRIPECTKARKAPMAWRATATTNLGRSATSAPQSLYELEKLTVEADGEFAWVEGQPVDIKAKVTGLAPGETVTGYQWYYSKDDTNWKKSGVKSSMDGTTLTMTVPECTKARKAPMAWSVKVTTSMGRTVASDGISLVG